MVLYTYYDLRPISSVRDGGAHRDTSDHSLTMEAPKSFAEMRAWTPRIAFADLSQRERTCIAYMAAGYSDDAGGEMLGITGRGFRFHIMSAAAKSGASMRNVTGRTRLVGWYLSEILKNPELTVKAYATIKPWEPEIAFDALAPNERRCIALMSQGYTDEEIKLFFSPALSARTVRHYFDQAAMKSGAYTGAGGTVTRTRLVSWYMRKVHTGRSANPTEA